MNRIIITGRLGHTPELKTAKNGKEYTKITVAVNRIAAKDQPKLTDWFNVTVFGVTAAFVCKYFQKGDGIMVEGRMEDSPYKPEGSDKQVHSWNLIAERVEFGSGKGRADGNNQSADDSQAPEGFTQINDEDIPF